MLHRPDSSVFSIFQFLGNFLRSTPGVDGSSSPIHYTSVFSHPELDLPIDWLPVIVVFEIQALVATQSTHILNFFALSSESTGRTQSKKIFSQLNFHQEQLVELFVPGSSRTSRSTRKEPYRHYSLVGHTGRRQGAGKCTHKNQTIQENTAGENDVANSLCCPPPTQPGEKRSLETRNSTSAEWERSVSSWAIGLGQPSVK